MLLFLNVGAQTKWSLWRGFYFLCLLFSILIACVWL